MQSVGQQIREQRLRLGLKLEEISARSRISLRCLQAIESDDLSGISSPFLYKSFTRQFAEQVKLDYSTLASTIESAASAMPQPRVPGEGEEGRTTVAPLRIQRRPKSFRWLYSVGSFAFMLVACSSVYAIWQSAKPNLLSEIGSLIHLHSPNTSDNRSPATATPAIPQRATPSGSMPSVGTGPVERPVERPSVRRGRPTKQNEVLASAAAAPEPPLDPEPTEFRVELSAIERTWLSITEDGKQTFSGMLDPEEKKVLEGHDVARVRTGNAGGLSCVFNGKAIGPIGPRGQVRTVVFTKTNYEVLETPAPVALTHFPSIFE